MSATIIRMPGMPEAQPMPETQAVPEGLMTELRRARIRIAQLESSLTEAMRDNLANFNRAREAEQRLKELGS